MILITGNAGFIGKYLTTSLLKAGAEVKGIDIRPRRDSEKGFIQIDGNILDKELVRQNMTGIDCIIHLAAEHKDFGITRKIILRPMSREQKYCFPPQLQQESKNYFL